MVSLTTLCSTAFSALQQGPSTFLSFHFLSFSLCGSLEQQNPQMSSSFFLFINTLLNLIIVLHSLELTSKSPSPFSNPLVTVPNAPITIGIIVTCMFHCFFYSLARSRYLSFFSHSFSFILWSAGTAKSTILQVLFFLLIIIKSGLLAEIRWSVCMSKFHRSLCVSFCRTDPGLCIYHLFVWSNLNFLHISQWITLPPSQSCLTCICYFVASYLFSFWYDWFLWRCLVLLVGEILFLS